MPELQVLTDKTALQTPLRYYSERERLFIKYYCQTLNKSHSARMAGISNPHFMYNKPGIKEEITRVLRLNESTPEETIAGIRNISEANVADYFKPVTEFKSTQIRVPLSHVINELQTKIEFEDLFILEADTLLTKKEQEEILNRIRGYQKEIARLNVELKLNPGASRIIYTEPVETIDYVLDLEKIIEDKEKGIIQEVKYNEHGIQVKFYSALEAKRDLAKIQGLFKDGANVNVQINNLQDENIVFE